MRYYLSIAIIILYALLPYYALSQDLSGTLDISYNTSHTETNGRKSSSWNLFQSYYVNYTTYLTPVISSSLGIRYSHKNSDMQDQEIIYPFVNLGLVNEYFSGNLAYNYMEVKNSNNPNLITSFWNTNLTSQLEKWPKLSFQYTNTRQYDDLSKHKTDIKSTSLLSGFTYQYSILNMMYNYMRSTSHDYVASTNSKNSNHISRLGIYKSFWNNRISISTDGGYNYFNTITTVPKTGEMEQQRLAREAFYGTDSSPEHSKLSSSPNLIDGDKSTAVITAKEYMNVEIDLIYPQSVDTVYIYTNEDYFYNPTISSEVLEWAVYYTNDEIEPRTWICITKNAQFSYNESFHRFEIDFTSQKARHFKVIYYPGTTSSKFQITEIEAYGLEHVERVSKANSKTYTGNCVFSVRPLEKWTTAYYLSYYRTDTSTSHEKVTNYTFGQGINLTGDLSKYFLLTLSYQNIISHMVEAETRVNTYTFNWHSNPLETLNTTLTLSHTDTKGNEGMISKTNTFAFNSVFMLWKGVDANWDLNLARVDNVQAATRSTSLYSDLYLRALLTRHLSWDFGYSQDYQRIYNEETSSTASANIYSTLVYTPSSRLYGRIYLRYETTEGRFSHEYSLGCFITPKVQINANSSFMRSKDMDEMTHALDLNWDIARWSSLRMGYSYSYNHNNTTQKGQNFYVRFLANF